MARRDQDAVEESWPSRSNRRQGRGYRRGTSVQGRKGFGCRVRCGAGPGNITVRGLLSDERYVSAALDFLRATKFGVVKEGTIVR